MSFSWKLLKWIYSVLEKSSSYIPLYDKLIRFTLAGGRTGERWSAEGKAPLKMTPWAWSAFILACLHPLIHCKEAEERGHQTIGICFAIKMPGRHPSIFTHCPHGFNANLFELTSEKFKSCRMGQDGESLNYLWQVLCFQMPQPVRGHDRRR